MKSLVVGLATCFAMLAVAAPVLAEHFFFDSDGVKIHYTIHGEGEPIVLVHGYMASGSTNWGIPGVIRTLADDYQVITIDIRGHGRSDATASDDGYGIEMAKDVLRLLDHLELDSVYLAGYSMGGMITNKILTMRPERVRAAAVCGMGWYTPDPNPSDGSSSSGERRGPARYQAMAQSFRELATTKEEMVAVKTPTIIIVGSKDDIQLARVKTWREIRPDIPVVEISGANHVNCSFNPEFKKAVKKFFDDQVKAAKKKRR